MSKKNKRYVVRKWHRSGIFSTWQECEQMIHWFPNAQYKAFSSQQDAILAYQKNYKEYEWRDTIKSLISPEEKQTIWDPILSSIAVDASCSGNPWVLEFRWVHTQSHKELFSYGPFDNGTVNIGEFLALVEWLKYAKANKIKVVYTDSRTARARVRDIKVKTTLQQDKDNKELFTMVDDAIKRLKNNSVVDIKIAKRETSLWWEIPADYGRK